jgi:hypothetical protein
MTYLVDDIGFHIPNDCTRKVFIGDITQAVGDMSEYEMLEDWEQVMIEQGPKVVFWQQRNPDANFRVLTRKRDRYFKYVAQHRFIDVLY